MSDQLPSKVWAASRRPNPGLSPKPPCDALGSGLLWDGALAFGLGCAPACVGALRPGGNAVGNIIPEKFLCLFSVLKYNVAVAVCITLLAASFPQ